MLKKIVIITKMIISPRFGILFIPDERLQAGNGKEGKYLHASDFQFSHPWTELSICGYHLISTHTLYILK